MTPFPSYDPPSRRSQLARFATGVGSILAAVLTLLAGALLETLLRALVGGLVLFWALHAVLVPVYGFTALTFFQGLLLVAVFDVAVTLVSVRFKKSS